MFRGDLFVTIAEISVLILDVKVNDLRVKSPAKPNTDLHNGDLKFPFFSFSDSGNHGISKSR